jgi:hypothetical protein
VAQPYLVELARDTGIRGLLHGYLKNGTREEKTGILTVLAASGNRTSLPVVEPLTKDPETDVAQEAIRTMRTLQTR